MALCGRADLVRMLADSDDDKADFLAGLIGYRYVTGRPDADLPRRAETVLQDAAAQTETATFQPQTPDIDWAKLPFFFAEHFQPLDPETDIKPAKRKVKVYSMADLAGRVPAEGVKMPETPLLTSWPRLQRQVFGLIQDTSPSRKLDVDKLLHDFSRGRMPRSLPFQIRKRWPRQLNVIIDRSRRLTPFWQDQNKLMRRLERRLGRDNLREYRVDDVFTDPLPMGRARECRESLQTILPVLVLGDCGALSRFPPLIHHWQRKGRLFRAGGANTAVLFPAPRVRWPQRRLSAWNMAPWEISAAAVKGYDENRLEKRAQRLLSLLSHASRVEPGLLRTVRRLLPPGDADASTEANVWSHPSVTSASSVALTISRDVLKDLQAGYEAESPELRGKVARAIEQWHAALPAEIWVEEWVSLPLEDQLRWPREVRAVLEKDLQRIAHTIKFPEGLSPAQKAAMYAWFKRFMARTGFNADLWANRPGLSRALHEAAACVFAGEVEVETAAGYDPRREGRSGTERFWTVDQTGDEFRVVERLADTLDVAPPGSPVAILRSTRPYLHGVTGENLQLTDGYLAAVYFDPQSGKVTEDYLTKPPWAEAIGEDAHGIWATLRYVDVEQRMRWIPPGQFMMGSPKDEAERYNDEVQHPVTLTHGFWLFDTPVTQALWQAVMGNNPSHFMGPERPVERVKWNGCREFIEKINREIPGLKLRLPTEAQWEYACRAGTTTPFYTGENLTTDQANYDGNNSYKNYPKGKYRSETTPVGSFAPNGWGLYDMLGNVWEWCADWWQEDLGSEAVVDPTGPKKGDHRVYRGGSWRDGAQIVRATVRSLATPGNRSSRLGFRCARVQVPADGGSGPGGAGQAADVPQSKAELFTAGGTKYVIGPQNSAAIIVPRGRRLQLQTDQGILTLSTLTKPVWAEAIGRDRFGLWLRFKFGEVSQGLRWIPPGQFMMGSPKNEAGRYERETQHLVTLTRGFWLFDTPVTQALWKAVMGDNPSRFQSDDRPVELVSWEACREFMEKLNQDKPGLALTFPSEAQWEYACRAGSIAATYAGDLEIKGANNAPLLDEIAWYGGNSGVDFELENSFDSSGWSEKQYDHQRAGTHPVGLKRPNPWGLYDMLGNVWECCADWWLANIGSEVVVDPAGPQKGADRVYRGGSWGSNARGMRAACRTFNRPGFRGYYLGFRCARVQDA